MGIQTVLNANPLEFVPKFVFSDSEIARRRSAGDRIAFYRDNFETAVLNALSTMFDSKILADRFKKYAKFGSTASYFKRIVDEVAGHVYSLPPSRRIGRNLLDVDPNSDELPTNDNETAYSDLMEQIHGNSLLDQGVRMAFAANTALVTAGHVKRLDSLVARVLTADQCSVIEDPDDCSRILGFAYQAGIWRHDGKDHREWVYWDDEVTFRFTSEGPTTQMAPHGLGMVPAFPIHARRPLNCFWDTTTGADLVEMQRLVSVLYTFVSKLHKNQGWKQLFLIGDTDEIDKNQLMDEEYAIKLPPNTSVTEIDLAIDASHYLGTIDHAVNSVASNYGINRDRLNQKTMGVSTEAGILERRQAAIQVARAAEKHLFHLLKALAPLTGKQIADDARFEVDFAEVEALADRKTQLEIWEMLRKLGYRNPLDDIAEINPELKSDEERQIEYERNIRLNEILLDMRRRTNAPANGNTGLDPEINGAAGPVAREVGPEAAQALLDAAKAGEQ